MFCSVSEARCVQKHINKEKYYVRARKADWKPTVEISEYLVKGISPVWKKVKTHLVKKLW